ncbi:MAG TPA: hypothetical protein VFT99_14530 [Roseiflexaceae bacterium]|nr:hypothetical protein [Roseiflexaceae bacterium]
MRLPRFLAAMLVTLTLLVNGSSVQAQSRVAAAAQTYVDPAGRWQISYPAGVLSPEVLGNGSTIFISRDRSTFIAIDSIPGDDASDEALHGRAMRALTRIYGKQPQTITALEQLDAPWQAGVSFATKKGSEGVALYFVDASDDQGWTYGVLLGSKKTSSRELKEAVLQTLATLQIMAPQSDAPPSGGIVKIK